jgi:hypothetical protein
VSNNHWDSVSFVYSVLFLKIVGNKLSQAHASGMLLLMIIRN